MTELNTSHPILAHRPPSARRGWTRVAGLAVLVLAGTVLAIMALAALGLQPANALEPAKPTSNGQLDTSASDQSQSPATDAAERAVPAAPMLIGYYETWEERQPSDPAQTRLAQLPAAVDMVVIAFAKPDLAYAGDLDITRTGLGFPFSGAQAKAAIAALKARQPKTKVLLSVGGAGYTNWDQLAVADIARLVRDFGLDGIDVDFEPAVPGCREQGGKIRCDVTPTLARALQRLRRALPRPLLLTIAGWSVGAYGEGAWANATPTSPYTGMLLQLLRSPTAAAIDMVLVMGYEGGPTYDPGTAYAAYKAAFAGPVALGFIVDEVVATPASAAKAQRLARDIAAKGGHVMLYSLQRQPPPAPAAERAAKALCRGVATVSPRDCAFKLP